MSEVFSPAAFPASDAPRVSARFLLVAEAAGLVLFQVFLALLLAEGSLADRYVKGGMFYDSSWYGAIVRDGYQVALPIVKGTSPLIAFFPGYPLVARLFAIVFRLPVPLVLLVAAQVMACVFWTYFLLFLRRWNVTKTVHIVAVLSVLCFPTSFYLVGGYSESVFLLGLLGFFFWLADGGAGSRPLVAALHGILMTATRIIGAPVAALTPLISFLLPGGTAPVRWKSIMLAVMTGLIASMGTLGFFLYCQLKFGHWDLYFTALSTGWDIHSNYLRALNPHYFRILLPLPTGDLHQVDQLNAIIPAATIVTFLLFVYGEWKTRARAADTRMRERIPYYAAAILMYVFAMAKSVEIVPDGTFYIGTIIRYIFPVFVMFILAGAHFSTYALRLQTRSRMRVLIALAVILLFSFAHNVTLVNRFVHGLWVS